MASSCGTSESTLSKIFYELEVSEFELRYFSLPLAQRKERADDQPIRLGRHALVQSFTRYWLWGGMLLCVLVALSRLDGRSLQETLLSPLATGGAELPPGLLAALLAYFLIGLWLLSQARLLEMDARWLLNGVEKDEQMRRTWQRSSLAILLGIALFAAFLPIGSTTALSQLVNLLIIGALFLAQLVVSSYHPAVCAAAGASFRECRSAHPQATAKPTGAAGAKPGSDRAPQ